MTHRIREQARSHKGSVLNVKSQAQKSPTQWSGFFFPQKPVLI
jgi:hypothetical protein